MARIEGLNSLAYHTYNSNLRVFSEVNRIKRQYKGFEGISCEKEKDETSKRKFHRSV